jgi:hypothetical protein
MVSLPLGSPAGPIKRRHLFEFEDLDWFPHLFRDTITAWLRDAFAGEYDPVVPLVVRLLEQEGSGRIVDLCSGGSGPWEYLKRQVDAVRAANGQDDGVTITLTDRFPNLTAFETASARIGAGVDFRAYPVDARRVPATLSGVRTLFTSFHHLDTADARAVLADAADSGHAIGVFEFTSRDWSVIRGVLRHVPMSMLRTVHRWRPRNRAQLFFTYLLPLIVLTSLWDAVVSQLRAYRPDELAALTAGLGGTGYRWETGQVFAPGRRDPITYVIGYPTAKAG